MLSFLYAVSTTAVAPSFRGGLYYEDKDPTSYFDKPYIFYSEDFSTGQNGRPYSKMARGGLDEAKMCGKFNLVAKYKWFYMIRDYRLYRVQPGSEKQEMLGDAKVPISDFVADEISNLLFYLTTNKELYISLLNGEEAELLQSNVHAFAYDQLTKQVYYYTKESGKVFKFNIRDRENLVEVITLDSNVDNVELVARDDRLVIGIDRSKVQIIDFKSNPIIISKKFTISSNYPFVKKIQLSKKDRNVFYVQIQHQLHAYLNLNNVGLLQAKNPPVLLKSFKAKLTISKKDEIKSYQYYYDKSQQSEKFEATSSGSASTLIRYDLGIIYILNGDKCGEELTELRFPEYSLPKESVLVSEDKLCGKWKCDTWKNPTGALYTVTQIDQSNKRSLLYSVEYPDHVRQF
ncbi:hypothetical protein ABK040_013070 [Willaertia magna]